MNELHRAHTYPALSGLACGVAALMCGMLGIPTGGRRGVYRDSHGPFAFAEYTTLDMLLTAVGLLLVTICLVHLVPLWRHTLQGDSQLTPRFLARAGMPRSLHELLLGVAAADGRIAAEERAIVARVMTRELPEVVSPQDLKNWATTVEPPRDPVVVASNLQPLLTADERRLVVAWCRAVADASGTTHDENAVLRRVQCVLDPTAPPAPAAP